MELITVCTTIVMVLVIASSTIRFGITKHYEDQNKIRLDRMDQQERGWSRDILAMAEVERAYEKNSQYPNLLVKEIKDILVKRLRLDA